LRKCSVFAKKIIAQSGRFGKLASQATIHHVFEVFLGLVHFFQQLNQIWTFATLFEVAAMICKNVTDFHRSVGMIKARLINAAASVMMANAHDGRQWQICIVENAFARHKLIFRFGFVVMMQTTGEILMERFRRLVQRVFGMAHVVIVLATRKVALVFQFAQTRNVFFVSVSEATERFVADVTEMMMMMVMICFIMVMMMMMVVMVMTTMRMFMMMVVMMMMMIIVAFYNLHCFARRRRF